ncbi:MgtC/SapB family protein [Xenorhabdus bovienii]|uniref:MgtC/SapB family protein n=1 Tax=Xenorhabdus bovienii TaxID=40576 RepID=UPI0004D66D9A|nr:MgtC/SapB family protein [Xenorhabdus bovienii]CDG88760.1 putative Inner membrane protein yafU [Xenorhabdus bovienii str. feltiae France]CDG93359.1 putative Inner membrane protein yafU [Xenorhabdus bovienii str. feltiae Florida]
MSRNEFERAFMDGSIGFENGTLVPLSDSKLIREKRYSELQNELQKNLNDNEDLYVFLTFEEAIYFVTNICGPNPNSSWKEAGYLCMDIVTSFTGNIIDAKGFYKLSKELSSNFGVKVTEFVDRYGNRSIKLTGSTGVRKFLTAAKYKVNNWKIIDMGIGTQGMKNGLIDGTRKVVFVAAGYRLLELAFRDEYDIYNFYGNITMDAAKTAVGLLAGVVVTAAAGMFLAAGTYALAVAATAIVASILVGSLLYYIDNKYGLSKALIDHLRKMDELEAKYPRPCVQPFGFPCQEIKLKW